MHTYDSTPQAIAASLGISRSELVERLARAGDEAIMEVLREGRG